MTKAVVKKIGILTSGGDAPGLNTAIRGLARTCMQQYGIKIFGIQDGYRGLIQGQGGEMGDADFSGILTRGGTILGTSRTKPFKNPVRDPKTGLLPIESIKKNYKKWSLDALCVLGGNGTNTTGAMLAEEGFNVVGLPKTIDNDIIKTDVTFGFHTAVDVATEAIDRLHTTAHSHNRIMVIEVMGHKAGWLGLYSGVAGGGDVILIPEIPYHIDSVAQHLNRRKDAGKPFSIVVVAEGALSEEESFLSKKEFKKRRKEMIGSIGYRVARELEAATGLESRVSVLGYLQRGGIPSAYDRVLATEFGVKAAHMVARGDFGKMVAKQGDAFLGVPLADVAGKVKSVKLDDSAIVCGREVDTCFGD
ncbi:MAG TPA: ATP-dependent 6-phosphofructokinase [Treponemataceae bacterium]|nr:ATP-dependent 6-phosphofructokinase [Treponemataceae bacterium]